MAISCSSLYTARDMQNYRTFTWWMTASMVAFAAATILIDGDFVGAAAGWALTVVTIALMVVAIRSYISFLRVADELLRKVHLEALAFAFGAGVVCMMGYRLCERLGAPKLDVNDAGLVLLVTWIGGQLLGARRYSVAEEQ